MEQRIKAIKTVYADHLFRSRLEARWAVYFDALGIKWEYESEGYAVNGSAYLPDFYFPELDFYGEVKPADFGDTDLAKWTAFAEAIRKPLVIFEGLPHAKDCRAFYYDGLVFTDYQRVIPFAHLTREKYGMFWHCGNPENWSAYQPYRAAISKAKQKQFEFTNSNNPF